MEADIRSLMAEGEAVRSRLLELVDEDAVAFEPQEKAYSTTCGACAAPLEIMRCCCWAIGLLEEMLEKGSTMPISDVGCGAPCCAAVLESTSLNVYINTRTLKDRAEAGEMLHTYGGRGERIAREVTRRLLRKD